MSTCKCSCRPTTKVNPRVLEHKPREASRQRRGSVAAFAHDDDHSSAKEPRNKPSNKPVSCLCTEASLTRPFPTHQFYNVRVSGRALSGKGQPTQIQECRGPMENKLAGRNRSTTGDTMPHYLGQRTPAVGTSAAPDSLVSANGISQKSLTRTRADTKPQN